MKMSTDNTPHLSGFAKKKALEAAGYYIRKLQQQGHAASDQVWCVFDSSQTSGPIIASDRLQGVAVNKALDALGGV